MAFVLVQHLAPDHKSILTELIKRYTRMRVQEVVDGMVVRPDCAYIIPPSHDMALFNGTLRLLEPSAPHGLRLPIDFFFRSLAQDQHERAICVVLSGTGSDGTLGARAIKGEGGMVMVQTPKSAAYDGMPRSAIATGLTDFVLPPAEMPARLMAYAAHAFGKLPHAISASAKAEDTLTKICILLRDKTSHDFSQYKQSTLERRIERRMALHQIDRQGDYVRFLQQDSGGDRGAVSRSADRRHQLLPRPRGLRRPARGGHPATLRQQAAGFRRAGLESAAAPPARRLTPSPSSSMSTWKP